ncbi:MAG: MerR family transcriptional regulator, partial [Microthrixaceae bacterium]
MGDAVDPEPQSEALSIGEVLAVLSEEFPDVTVSKIRFLESQGLVNPDRNASGYRQFDDADIERLRWILRQQRDKFLPLKVIKRALDSGVDVVDAGTDQPTLWTAVADGEVDRLARESDAAERETVRETERSRHATPADVVAALQEDPRPRAAQEPPRRSTGSSNGDPRVEIHESTEPVAANAAPADPTTAGSYGRTELLEAAGITADALDELEQFGLVAP